MAVPNLRNLALLAAVSFVVFVAGGAFFVTPNANLWMCFDAGHPGSASQQEVPDLPAPLDKLREMLQHGEKLHREFWALQDVSFTVETGRTLGIIGQNGSARARCCRSWPASCARPAETAS